jgi:hypothetical protein
VRASSPDVHVLRHYVQRDLALFRHASQVTALLRHHRWRTDQPVQDVLIDNRRDVRAPNYDLAFHARPHQIIDPAQRVPLDIDQGTRVWFALEQASSSWMNLVERWFAELTRRKLRRSAHRSVTELEADIRKWISEWNKDPRPFIWTKTADEILETLAAYCERIIDSRH